MTYYYYDNYVIITSISREMNTLYKGSPKNKIISKISSHITDKKNRIALN